MTIAVSRKSRSGDWRRSFVAANGARCHYCNRAGTLDEGPGLRAWHIDHMTPIARGGEDVEENLALSCKRCNLVKGVQEYKRFAAFARAAFWEPSDGVSEGDLDSLMDRWEHATDGQWLWLAHGDGGEIRVVIAPRTEAPLFEGPASRAASVVLTGRSEKPTERVASFLISAHRLIPQMIAEIRQMREAQEKEVA